MAKRRKAPPGYCPACMRPLPREEEETAATEWRVNGNAETVKAVTAYQAWEKARNQGITRGKFYECTVEKVKHGNK